MININIVKFRTYKLCNISWDVRVDFPFGIKEQASKILMRKFVMDYGYQYHKKHKMLRKQIAQ